MYQADVIKEEGKDVIITASHNGVLVVFDPSGLKRKGKLMNISRSSWDDDYMTIFTLDNQPYAVAYTDDCVTIWDITARKKLKKYNFEDYVWGVTVSGKRIIISHGEDLRAIGLNNIMLTIISDIYYE